MWIYYFLVRERRNRYKGTRVKEVSGLIFRRRRIYVDLLLLGQGEKEQV